MSSSAGTSPETDDIDDLPSIFTICRKRDLEKHCRTATVSMAHFANFIRWCGSKDGPNLHTSFHRHFHPEHLILSDKDLSALDENGVGKFKPAGQKTANKVFAMLDERRLLSGHLFWDARTWHLFYFDNHDRNSYKNHWVGGPHIHLINHLWPNQTADSAWQHFCNGNPVMRGALHLRYV